MERAVRAGGERARRIRLSVARLRSVCAFGGRVARDPARIVCVERERLQPRMVVALHDPERVPVDVLLRDEPRLVVAAAFVRALRLDSADAEALSLAERVEREALVLAEHPTQHNQDRAG